MIKRFNVSCKLINYVQVKNFYECLNYSTNFLANNVNQNSFFIKVKMNKYKT